MCMCKTKSYFLVQAIVDSMNTCATQKGTFKIINEVSGTIRPSRYNYMIHYQNFFSNIIYTVFKH